MTVGELEVWAMDEQEKLRRGFPLGLINDSTPAYMLKLIADWRAMREYIMAIAIKQGECFYPQDFIEHLRLKP